MQPPGLPARLTENTMENARLLAYRKLSDLALAAKARAGDAGALHTLIERHGPRVNRLASQLLGDFEDARDAAQESLVKLCTRIRQFRGDAQFVTWLHRLVVNTCRDVHARKRARSTDPLALEDEPAGDESDPTRMAMIGDLRRDLVDGLSKLSADQRAVVVLRDALDLSYEEVARRARMPVGTAKSYVHRGRARLRVRLEEHSHA
ncbi:MAG TPA: RNA polymerase sigma factor [Gaiellaceae bacterium]|nr:RNA polymerase sigma factor [Gaiellaceae bacterium]